MLRWWGLKNSKGNNVASLALGRGHVDTVVHHYCTIIGAGGRDWRICMSTALGIGYYKIKLSWLLIKSLWRRRFLYTPKTVRRHK